MGSPGGKKFFFLKKKGKKKGGGLLFACLAFNAADLFVGTMAYCTVTTEHNQARPSPLSPFSAAPAAAETRAANAEPSPGMQLGPPVMDQAIFAHAIFNQLEGRWNGSNPEFRWDGQGWIGTDYDKLWIKSEGTLSRGAVDDGQQQFLYSRAVTTYFDLQGGLRSDIDSRPTRNWAAFGIQGLAPYFFDLEVTGFVSGEGHLAGKLEASYDLLLT